MKSFRLKSTNELISVDPSSEMRGGEGSVYRLKDKKYDVVKIYHQQDKRQTDKLKVMLKHPPHDPMAARGHNSIAWPKDLVVNKNGLTVGFQMPLAEGSSAFSYLLPKARSRQHPHANYKTLMRICRNIASAIEEIHSTGHAVGDINMSNILIRPNALVTLIDCDSFQIKDPLSGIIHTCRVGMEYYTPPEHQGKRFDTFNGGTEHDAFAMAVLFFQLLMESMHPFAGTYIYGDGSANVAKNIQKNLWTYDPARKQEFRLRKASPPFEMQDPGLQELFIRCFRDGATDPSLRPSAKEWKEELDTAEQYLKTCTTNPKHLFGEHLNQCPWCERSKKLNRNKTRNTRKKSRNPVTDRGNISNPKQNGGYQHQNTGGSTQNRVDSNQKTFKSWVQHQKQTMKAPKLSKPAKLNRTVKLTKPAKLSKASSLRSSNFNLHKHIRWPWT